jgi:hypothetical protein
LQAVYALSGDAQQQVHTAAGARRQTLAIDFNLLLVLQVEAEASTDSRPLPGFTPRQGAGFPLLGKSFT